MVTGLLREELGFDGVVITDGLEMRAMTDHYGSGEIAVAAIQAGGAPGRRPLFDRRRSR